MVTLIVIGSNSGSLLGWFADQLLARPVVLAIFALVALYVIYQGVRVSRETRACKAWISNNDVNGNAQAVQQLRLYLAESERWRHQGVAVAMTDYSDRIDSLIEGLTDQLHNGVNLFLIVGLAGTFFGMAEFARQAPSLSANTDAKDVLEALRLALGHSFPIGFVGLCLTIVAHPIAGWFDAQLREATRDAVNHALRLRTAALNQDGSGIAEELRKLPDVLAAAIAQVHGSMLDQLKPLLEIPQAIRDSQKEFLEPLREIFAESRKDQKEFLEPLREIFAESRKDQKEFLEPLREIFAESRKEWRETVTKLGKQSSKTAEAIEHLEAPINALTSKIAQITDLVDANEQAVNRINARAEEVAALLLSVQGQITVVVESIASVTTDLARIPDNTRDQLLHTSEELIASIRAYYERLGIDYVNSVRDLASANATEITAASGRAASSVESAAESLRISADSMTPEIRKAITDGADRLRGHLEVFNRAFGEHFPGAVEKLQQTLGSASEQIDIARRVLESMATSATSSAEHARAWAEVETRLAVLQGALRLDTERLTALGTQIEKSAQAHASVSPVIQDTTNAFKEVAHGLREMAQRRPNTAKAPQKSWFGKIFGGRSGGNGA
jgi:ABC-type transporter Mla subunit MlaD